MGAYQSTLEFIKQLEQLQKKRDEAKPSSLLSLARQRMTMEDPDYLQATEKTSQLDANKLFEGAKTTGTPGGLFVGSQADTTSNASIAKATERILPKVTDFSIDTFSAQQKAEADKRAAMTAGVMPGIKAATNKGQFAAGKLFADTKDRYYYTRK
jgi:hypothetical protein